MTPEYDTLQKAAIISTLAIDILAWLEDELPELEIEEMAVNEGLEFRGGKNEFLALKGTIRAEDLARLSFAIESRYARSIGQYLRIDDSNLERITFMFKKALRVQSFDLYSYRFYSQSIFSSEGYIALEKILSR